MQALNKRLRPLLIADFFAGLMFFYPVTFPLMHHLGFSVAEMSLYALTWNVVILAIGVPSGILADRWSRKKVIMLGQVIIAIGAAILGFAHTFIGFIIGAVFLSIYFAFRSGIREAVIYDVLLENNKREDYEKQLGKLRAYNTAGNVISSLLGALIAATIGFRAPYFLSIVSCLAALVCLAGFKEPQLHRKAEATKLRQHTLTLLRSVSQHREMKLLVVTSVLIGIEFSYMLEVDPLWPIALGLATIWYGPLNAFLLSSQGVAAPLAKRMAGSATWTRAVIAVFMLAALGLLLRNIFVIALSEFSLLAAATCLMVVLSGKIQDKLPSSQRSGVESVVSTLATLAFMVSLLIFIAISKHHSVFVAAWLIVLTTLLGSIGVFAIFNRRKAVHVSLPEVTV